MWARYLIKQVSVFSCVLETWRTASMTVYLETFKSPKMSLKQSWTSFMEWEIDPRFCRGTRTWTWFTELSDSWVVYCMGPIHTTPNSCPILQVDSQMVLELQTHCGVQHQLSPRTSPLWISAQWFCIWHSHLLASRATETKTVALVWNYCICYLVSNTRGCSERHSAFAF